MKNKKINFIISILLVISALALSVGYAAINSISMDIEGKISFTVSNKLFISDVSVYETNNASGTVNYYNNTLLDTSVELSDDSSLNPYVIFAVTLYNNADYNYLYSSYNYMLGEDTYDNENIIFEVSNLNENDIISSKSSHTFYVTFKYNSTSITDNTLKSKINFVFGTKFKELILANNILTTSGDGLYNYNNKYYFSGSNVNNYVWFNCDDGFNSDSENCEKWRIVSIEDDDSIKLVRDDVISQETIVDLENKTNFWTDNIGSYNYGRDIQPNGTILFDLRNRRPQTLSADLSYCITGKNGCNAFVSDNNITNNVLYKNLNVDTDSLVRLYLENVYFPYGLKASALDKIKSFTSNIGLIDVGLNIDNVVSSEMTIQTTSNVSLLNVSDFIYSSTNTDCKTKFTNYSCDNNWLALDARFYFINGKINDSNAQVWTNKDNYSIVSQDANNPYYLRPVVVLKSDTMALYTINDDSIGYYVLLDN